MLPLKRQCRVDVRRDQGGVLVKDFAATISGAEEPENRLHRDPCSREDVAIAHHVPVAGDVAVVICRSTHEAPGLAFALVADVDEFQSNILSMLAGTCRWTYLAIRDSIFTAQHSSFVEAEENGSGPFFQYH